MTKYIILIALVAFRIIYHPSPAATFSTPFETTSPVKVVSIPAGQNKPVPGAGIISSDKVNVDKVVENNKLVAKKFLRFELVWRNRVYYCTRLQKKSSETTITETFTIIATA